VSPASSFGFYIFEVEFFHDLLLSSCKTFSITSSTAGQFFNGFQYTVDNDMAMAGYMKIEFCLRLSGHGTH